MGLDWAHTPETGIQYYQTGPYMAFKWQEEGRRIEKKLLLAVYALASW